MKDILEITVKIGDTVVFTGGGQGERGLKIGEIVEIVGITKTNNGSACIIKDISSGRKQDVPRFSNQILRITTLKEFMVEYEPDLVL